MTPGQVYTLIFTGLVPASTPNGTVLNNTAYITSPTDPNPHNATAITNVETSAILSITKSAVATVVAGNSLVYTIVVRNNGPSDAQNVMFNDIIPILTGVTWTLNGVNQGLWTNLAVLGVMTPGQIITLVFTGLVPASTPDGTVLNNTAYITSPTDPNPHNATAITNVGTSANLSITKSAAATVVAGNSLVYTIVVRNNGPSDAQNVMFSDVIPVLTGVTWTLNGAPMGGWTGSYNLGVMTPGQVYTLIFTGLVPASTPNGTVLNNTASVTSPTDPVEHNATAITNVNTLANLSLSKVNDPVDVVVAGHNLVYTLVLTNSGPSVARDVVFTDDQLSSYLLNRFYRYSVNGGAWSVWTGFSGALVLNVSNIIGGPMGVGDTFAVMINSTVNPSTPAGTVINNFANVTSSTSPFNVLSPTVTNNVETSANLEITKSAVATVVAGNSLVYTIVVRNNGPSDAQNVLFTDVIPVLTGVTWTLNGVQIRVFGLIRHVLGVMAPGQIITLVFTGLVPASTPNGTVLNNTASVTSPTDPIEHNATAITNVETSAILSITKSAAATVVAGHNLVYTVVVTNNGPSDAQNVLFTDVIPVLTGVTWTLNGVDQGLWANSAVLGVMAPGQIITLVFTGLVPASTPNGTVLNNTAYITSPTDPNPHNATAITNVGTLQICRLLRMRLLLLLRVIVWFIR